MTQPQAVENCENLGMELISVSTRQIHNAISKLYKFFPTLDHSWTSGSDKNERGTFVWEGSVNPLGPHAFSNWYPKYPSNTNVTTYIVIRKDDYLWVNQGPEIFRAAFCILDLDVFLFQMGKERQENLRRLGQKPIAVKKDYNQ